MTLYILMGKESVQHPVGTAQEDVAARAHGKPAASLTPPRQRLTQDGHKIAASVKMCRTSFRHAPWKRCSQCSAWVGAPCAIASSGDR